MQSLEGLYIDINTVGDIAVNIKKIRESINSELSQIQKEMNTVGERWKSPAHTELTERYQGFQKMTEQFDKDLLKYAEYLLETAREYGYVEKEINKAAESFID